MCADDIIEWLTVILTAGIFCVSVDKRFVVVNNENFEFFTAVTEGLVAVIWIFFFVILVKSESEKEVLRGKWKLMVMESENLGVRLIMESRLV